MSLKHFHIFFILTALGLLGFLGYWSGSRFYQGENGANLALALCAVAGLAVGIPYLGWFIRKAQKL